MKIREGRNVLGWYSPIPIRRIECDGVHGNPAESIHVHRNYWSCDKPNLRLVQYKPDMPRSQSHEGKQLVSRANDLKVQLFYQAFKQNSALRQQMQYAWNMARSLGHEAKQLISRADNEKYTSLFYLKHWQMQCTWGMPRFFWAINRSSSYQARMTYSDLRRFTSTNAASVIDGNLWLVLKPWSGTAHNKREWLERHLVLHARMTSNPVLQAIKQKYALHRNMKYSIREICLFLKALKQNSQFQGRMTWFILRSSSHLDKTALNAETLDAAYVKYASFLKPWSKTTHFKGGSHETYRVLRPLR